MANLSLRQVSKRFGHVEVLRDLSLEIPAGEFAVFLGPSGCGKSTLLRIVAGLEAPTSGEIHLGDARIDTMRPGDRGVAMVFQHYALYPHMTVPEHGVRLAQHPHPASGDHAQGRRSSGDAGNCTAAGSQARSTQRRTAPACRHWSCHRQTAEGVPVRRTAFKPRRRPAQPHAHRVGPTAPAHANHHGLRHPRPGGSDDHGNAHRGDEPGPHRAGWHADGGIPAAKHTLCRWLRRHASDEFPARRSRRRTPGLRRCLPARRNRDRHGGACRLSSVRRPHTRHSCRAYRARRRRRGPRCRHRAPWRTHPDLCRPARRQHGGL